MKCRLCWPKWAVVFGALAISLRASLNSRKILLATVLSQGMGSLNPFLEPEAKPSTKCAPKGKHVQLFKMRRKVGKGFYSTAAHAQLAQMTPKLLRYARERRSRTTA